MHVRTKTCYDFNEEEYVTCNCAVTMREGNNMIGVYACETPPYAIRYLVDPLSPGDVTVSIDGKIYTVCKPFHVHSFNFHRNSITHYKANHKKLCCPGGTARCAISVEIMRNVANMFLELHSPAAHSECVYF